MSATADQPLLQSRHQPKQNWAETHKILDNLTEVSGQMEHREGEQLLLPFKFHVSTDFWDKRSAALIGVRDT